MHRWLLTCTLLLSSASVFAADMLPLKNGIFVPVGRPCKGASNAEMVNYWGGRNALGNAGENCTIKALTHVGEVYTIRPVCKNLDGHAEIGSDVVVRIAGPDQFLLGGRQYRYCGPTVQF